jgi:predicted kinase
VVDATNATAAARRPLLRRAGAASVPAVAIVLDLPATLVAARIAARRERPVPLDVVRRQLHALAVTLRNGHLEGEGFALVIHLTEPAAVDRLRIERIDRR